jgi:hypothetical protein
MLLSTSHPRLPLPRPDDLGSDPEIPGVRFGALLGEEPETMAAVHDLPLDRADADRPAVAAA